MQKTNVIYFDLGKVLVDFDWSIAVDQMARQSPLDPKAIYDTVTSGFPAMAYELGQMGSEEFFPSLKAKISFAQSPDYLRQLWNDIFTAVPGHIQIARSLSLHYPLGLLSNTNASHAAHIDSTFDFFKLFSARIFSFEAGRAKPQRAMYELAAARFSANASEILLIDDLEENVLAARALGWQAIHCTKDKVLLNELRAAGLQGLDDQR